MKLKRKLTHTPMLGTSTFTKPIDQLSLHKLRPIHFRTGLLTTKFLINKIIHQQTSTTDLNNRHSVKQKTTPAYYLRIAHKQPSISSYRFPHLQFHRLRFPPTPSTKKQTILGPSPHPHQHQTIQIPSPNPTSFPPKSDQ